MDPLVPVFDNHIHLRASFRGVEAAKDFERAGGTAMMLTHTPYDDLPIRTSGDYDVAYGRTLDMADAVRRATSLRVFVALGPYPVEFLRQAERDGIGPAADVARAGIDLAVRRIREGRAVAIGEVGRPHFPTEPDLLRACDEILGYAMARARDAGCAVILHTEDPTAETFARLAALADDAGLPRERVVKHHSPPLTHVDENHGIVPSVLAKEELVTRAIRNGPGFLLETDYIDDPRRPGAVLGPATVPRKTKAWLRGGILSESQALSIHRDLPERTYGIALE